MTKKTSLILALKRNRKLCSALRRLKKSALVKKLPDKNILESNDFVAFAAFVAFTYIAINYLKKIILLQSLSTNQILAFFYNPRYINIGMHDENMPFVMYSLIVSFVFSALDSSNNLSDTIVEYTKKNKYKIALTSILIVVIICGFIFYESNTRYVQLFVFCLIIFLLCLYPYYITPRFLLKWGVSFSGLFLVLNIWIIGAVKIHSSNIKNTKDNTIWIREKQTPDNMITVHIGKDKKSGRLLYHGNNYLILNNDGETFTIPVSSISWIETGRIKRARHQIAH